MLGLSVDRRMQVWTPESPMGRSISTLGIWGERVPPRSANSCAAHLLVIGAPRWECRVNSSGSTLC